MNLRIFAGAIAVGVTLISVGLIGCTSGTSGDPTPAATTSNGTTSGASATVNHPTAPLVAHPLDASAAIAQPCISLKSADVSGLNIVNAMSQSGGGTSAASGCTWSGDSGGGISISWETADTNGLSDLYAKSSTMAYWKPTTVAGYPAVYGDSISDGRSQGDCVLNTAVSNKLFFIAQFDNPLNTQQSCALAAQAAADVIKNLGGS